MKIFKGIVKRVPKEEHFEAYDKGILEMSDVKLIDTLIKCNGENGDFELLPIRLSYCEVDKNGNEKFTYDEQNKAYVKAYKQTPILYARGKEKRIIIELGEFSPVKVAVSEQQSEDKVFYRVECVQSQHMGME